jgi:hypothetical protein
MKLHLFVTAAAMVASAANVQAATVLWTDWTQQPTANVVVGTVAGVGVTYTGPRLFAQITGGGTDYWVTTNLPTSYTQGIVNRPVGTDIIALNAGGTKTITFASPVTDVFMALTSWNGVTVTFDRPFTVVSQGAGFWGTGTFGVNGTSTGFTGNSEVHGVLKFAGTMTSLTFTDTSENWHGFTIGIGQAGGVVPEPQSWAMLIAGFGLVGATMRRRRMVAA